MFVLIAILAIYHSNIGHCPKEWPHWGPHMLPLSPIHNFELSLLIKVPNVRHFFLYFNGALEAKKKTILDSSLIHKGGVLHYMLYLVPPILYVLHNINCKLPK